MEVYGAMNRLVYRRLAQGLCVHTSLPVELMIIHQKIYFYWFHLGRYNCRRVRKSHSVDL